MAKYHNSFSLTESGTDYWFNIFRVAYKGSSWFFAEYFKVKDHHDPQKSDAENEAAYQKIRGTKFCGKDDHVVFYANSLFFETEIQATFNSGLLMRSEIEVPMDYL